MILRDPYRPRASLIHRLDARVKVLLAFGFILATALTPLRAYPLALVLLALTAAAAILAELGVGYVWARAALVLPFALAALPLAATTPGAPLLTWGPVTLTAEGLAACAGVLLKAWLSAQAAIVLTAATPFPHLLAALRALRVPRLPVAIIGLMWRYLFVLADEALRLTRARAARSGVGAGGPLLWRAQVTGGMVGNLFLRAFDRAERIYAAMVARGYDGDIRTLPLAPLQPAQKTALSMGLGLLLTLTLGGVYLWR